MRRLLGCAAPLALLLASGHAQAEDAGPEATHRLEYTTEPLRLGLTRDAFSFKDRMPGCERVDGPEDNWLTRELAPHLHFLAIVRNGCGMETGGGGGLTYSAEIRPNVFFVTSIGAWLTPPIDSTRQMRLDPLLRLDLVFPFEGGRAVNIGLFATSTSLGLGFGGVF
jgi:hypothetical protein